MHKDIIISTIVLMLLITMIPISGSNNIDTENVNSDRDVFNKCYIEIEGDIYTQWKICFLKPFGDYRSIVVYWHLEFRPGSQILIYDELDGEILSEYNEPRQINILAFGGIYIPSRFNDDSPLHISIKGNVTKIVSKKLSEPTNNKISTENINSNDKVSFTNCYIELSGEIHNDWPAFIKLPNLFRLLWVGPNINNVLFGTYCYILYENTASIKIFEEKDDDIIWEHDGVQDPLITIIGFKGDFEYIEIPYYLDRIVFSGNALFTSIKLGDWGY